MQFTNAESDHYVSVCEEEKKYHFIILWQLDALNISNPARETLCLEQV